MKTPDRDKCIEKLKKIASPILTNKIFGNDERNIKEVFLHVNSQKNGAEDVKLYLKSFILEYCERDERDEIMKKLSDI